MLVIADSNDSRASRNANALLGLYEMMLNERRPMDAVRKFLAPDYIQHNPRLPDGAEGTGRAFEQRALTNPDMRVVVHRIVASGDYVCAHVNFMGIYSNDPSDPGVAGVDIFRFDDDGLIREHWDVLQPVPARSESANGNGMFEDGRGANLLGLDDLARGEM